MSLADISLLLIAYPEGNFIFCYHIFNDISLSAYFFFKRRKKSHNIKLV